MSGQAEEGLLSPFLQRVRLKAVRPYLHGDVLDCGCGNGALAAFVPRKRYVGYDRSTEAIASARARFPSHTFLGEMPQNSRFDTIVAVAVLEHLPNPSVVVRQWMSKLRIGGRIIITTPHRAFGCVHDAGARIGLFSADAADEHETLFYRASLLDLALSSGLDPVLYRRFLGGANQLCIWSLATSRTAEVDTDAARSNSPIGREIARDRDGRARSG